MSEARPWTSIELNKLADMRSQRWSIRRCAEELDRTRYSAQAKIRDLKDGVSHPADLPLLVLYASDLCWDMERLAALLARVDLDGAVAWRAELIEMAIRLHGRHMELINLRDGRTA